MTNAEPRKELQSGPAGFANGPADGAPAVGRSSSDLACAHNETLMRCTGLSKSFGGIRVLKDVSVEVRADEVVGLVGPNGAGKTTLFNCLTGFEAPDEGTVWFRGKRIDNLPAFRISRLGLVRT